MTGMNVVSPNEQGCVGNLEQYKVLNTKSEPVFDQLAATAAEMLNMPLAMINFIDNHKAWSLSDQDGASDITSDVAENICSMAILKDNFEKFETVSKNPGLILNPMILGELGLQFFASAAIVTNGGLNVGTVCVIDSISRNFSSDDQKKLEWVASMITIEMNKRLSVNAVA